MKTSFRLATKNILSYFLANLGMVIVVLILALIIAVPIAIVAIAFIAPLSEATLEALAVWAMANPLAVGTIALLVLIPIVSIFLTIEGSLYGMTHDLVTTSETKAESAFSYLRRKFLTFVGAGAILTIVIAVPPVVAWGLTSIAMGYTIAPLASTVLTVRTCASASGWAMSATCSSRSASSIPSRVVRNAATRWVGSLLMNPTVSVNRTCTR